MLKWVVRLAGMAAILGLLGSIVIVFQITAGKSESTLTKNTTDSNKTAPRFSEKKADVEKLPDPADSTVENSFILAAESDVAEASKVVLDTTEAPVTADSNKMENIDSIFGKAEKSKTEKREIKIGDQKKQFTSRELQGLVKNINKTKQKYRVLSNCVQIHSTPGANSKRRILQLERYLKMRKFSIAGRETIDKNITGVHITRNGNCVRLTVGRF